jgi:hypothetical protein
MKVIRNTGGWQVTMLCLYVLAARM